MITVEVFNKFEKDGWRELLLSLNGTPIQLPEILQTGARPEDILYLVFKKDGATVAASTALRTQKKLLRVFSGAREIYLPMFPAALAGLDEGDICRALISFAKAEGYAKLEVDPRWGKDFSAVDGMSGYRGHALAEFVLDLRLDLETLLKGMHKKHRKNVREAGEHNLEIVEDRSLEGFLKLREMQQTSSERSADRGNSYAIQGEEHFRAYFDAVYKDGPGSVLFAMENGLPVAALAYLAFGRRAITVRSGSNQRGYETSAMYLLQFELVRRLKETGYEELNIGAVPAEARAPEHPQHGLYTYKRYYGGEERISSGIIITP